MLLFSVIFIGCDNEDEPEVETKPTFSSSSPANDATDVAVDQQVVVTFSEAMDASTLTSTSFTLSHGTTGVVGIVTYSGLSATFAPVADLQAGTVYTAGITTEATSAAGIALESALTFSFTTESEADLVVPEISTMHPIDHAIDVSRNQVISLTFSEVMDASTISTSTFTLSDGSSVSGTVEYAGTTAIFSPDDMLVAGVLYTAAITTGVTDLAGNALADDMEWTFTTGGSATGLEPVELGTSANYVILAKTAINNSSTSAITGDLALSPAATSYITGLALTDATGYATSSQVTGNVYAADMADPTPVNLTTAVENMITAYNDAAGRPSPDFLELATGNIGGKTLIPGLYKWTTTVTMPANVVISGGEDDIWIFQISGDLNMSAAVSITLSGGAQAKNIFWQVAGEATFGTTSHFEGVILSMTGITFQTGASINGRALAQTAVILDSNAVTKPN